MADSLRGDGLYRADLALEALLGDPERLERARARFSESPPSYRSQLSGTTTLSQSPNPPSEAQQRREEREWKLRMEHRASLPYYQFDAQYSEELARLFEADDNRTYQRPPGLDNIYDHADKNVRMRWIEQGIWNDAWNDEYRPGGQWKHEETLVPGSETGSNTMPSAQTRGTEAQRKRSVKSDEEARREQRERAASRPYHQFTYQVARESERIQEELNPPKPPRRNPMTQAIVGHDLFRLFETETLEWRTQEESRDGEAVISPPPDINTTAYERVKSAWIKQQIWDKKWGVLPGMSWKHEQPFEELLREELGDDSGPGDEEGVDDNQFEPVGERGGRLFGPDLQQEPAPVGATYGALETNGDGIPGMLPWPHHFQRGQSAESSSVPGSGGLMFPAQDASPAESPLAMDAHNSAARSSQDGSLAARRTP